MSKTPRLSKVLVVGNNPAVQRMFNNNGFSILTEEKGKILGSNRIQPDLICFTGGEDVDPVYYKEGLLSRTRCNPKRDAREALLFEMNFDIPKVGICRGGQFLNVMSGGALWQHVNNHASNHDMVDLLFDNKTPIPVTSTHHQMMIPGKEGYLLGVTKVATEYLSARPKREKPKYDAEIVWYPKTKSLCFQPHPEYLLYNGKNQSTKHTDHFFKLIDWAFDLPLGEE